MPLPPNRPGGFPASGSPVSGFAVVRCSAGHACSVATDHRPAWVRGSALLAHAIPAPGRQAAQLTPPQTGSLGAGGNSPATRATSGSHRSRLRSGSARPAAWFSHPSVPAATPDAWPAAISCRARRDPRASHSRRAHPRPPRAAGRNAGSAPPPSPAAGRTRGGANLPARPTRRSRRFEI